VGMGMGVNDYNSSFLNVPQGPTSGRTSQPLNSRPVQYYPPPRKPTAKERDDGTLTQYPSYRGAPNYRMPLLGMGMTDYNSPLLNMPPQGPPSGRSVPPPGPRPPVTYYPPPLGRGKPSGAPLLGVSMGDYHPPLINLPPQGPRPTQSLGPRPPAPYYPPAPRKPTGPQTTRQHQPTSSRPSPYYSPGQRKGPGPPESRPTQQQQPLGSRPVTYYSPVNRPPPTRPPQPAGQRPMSYYAPVHRKSSGAQGGYQPRVPLLGVGGTPTMGDRVQRPFQ